MQKQEQILASAGLVSASDAIAFADQLASSGATPTPESGTAMRGQATGGRSYGRAISMSGMDVWGDMALGDMSELGKSQLAGLSSGQVMSTVTPASAQGFSFSQPDTMPPR